MTNLLIFFSLFHVYQRQETTPRDSRPPNAERRRLFQN